jgi:2-aminoadipate transaminase
MHSYLSHQGKRTQEPPISWLMKTALDHPGLVSLAAGFTDSESLPLLEVRRLLNGILRGAVRGRAALQYGSTAGDKQLRQMTMDRLRELDATDGPGYCPERTLMTHGSQQILYLVAEALCDEGDIVLVEDPTYFVFLGILQSRGVRGEGIRIEPDGLSLPALEQCLERLHRSGELSRVKFLYLVSYYQNPTGYTTSLEKKEQALRLLRRYERAAGHPIFLLEDAAYRELRFEGEDIPSALALDPRGDRVIYTSTYSKPFATGVRVGYGVMPAALARVTRRLKGSHDFGTANLLQALVAQAVASGAFRRHLPKLARRYSAKAKMMDDALRKHLPPSACWHRPAGGLYFWVVLPPGIRAGMKSRLFQAALKEGVLYVPGELCYVPMGSRRAPANEMRLSFGNASERDIHEGVARLGRVLKSHLR